MTIPNLKESQVSPQPLNLLTNVLGTQLILVQLTSKQVIDSWNQVWVSIKEALPIEATAEELEIENNVKEAIIKEELKVYFYLRGGELLAIASVVLQVEPITRTRSLFIYSLFGVNYLSVEEWIKALHLLRKVAKKQGCKRILAQSTNDKVRQIVKCLGGDDSIRLIQLEV